MSSPDTRMEAALRPRFDEAAKKVLEYAKKLMDEPGMPEDGELTVLGGTALQTLVVTKSQEEKDAVISVGTWTKEGRKHHSEFVRSPHRYATAAEAVGLLAEGPEGTAEEFRKLLVALLEAGVPHYVLHSEVDAALARSVMEA